MESVADRSEIDEEYTWDLESIFATEEEWEQAFENVHEDIEVMRGYEGRTTADAETVLATLEHRDELMRTVNTVAAYARHRSDEDTRDQEAQAMRTRAESLRSEAVSAASFVEPELGTLTAEEFESMVEAVPALETYDHYVDDVLRQKPHTRSAEVEAVLADIGEVLAAPGRMFSMLSDADMTFPSVETPDGESVEITQSNVTTLLKRPDRDFRQRVYEAYFGEWETVRNTVATAYEHSVKADVKLARIRNYDSAREAALDRPNVPVDVYDVLIETVEDNLDLLARYCECKRDRLDVENLQMWDLYAPVVESDSPTITYEQAREYIVESVEPLGRPYQSLLEEGFDARWIDVYENDGKYSGAYSGGTYDTHPFILMNYQEDITSMYTLAHELGHSLHSEFTKDAQPYVYSGYEMFVAEVASTVNEALLTKHLLETVDDDQIREHVYNEFLERVRSTLYRQTMFAEFERRTHELVERGEALTADRLDECFRQLKSRYYEPVVIDDHIGREWMRIPHFYRAFYVFQYATGISAALAITDRVLTEDGDAAADYLAFLRRGSRGYPLELLEIAGVDMRRSDPIDRALETFEEVLDEFEAQTS